MLSTPPLNPEAPTAWGVSGNGLSWQRQHISVLPSMHPLLRAAAIISPLLQRGLQAAHSQRVMFDVPLHGAVAAPLHDHQVQGQGIFPGAGHLEVSAGALRALGDAAYSDSNAAITEVAFHAPFLLGKGPLRVSVEFTAGRVIVAGVGGLIHMSGIAALKVKGGASSHFKVRSRTIQALVGHFQAISPVRGKTFTLHIHDDFQFSDISMRAVQISWSNICCI